MSKETAAIILASGLGSRLGNEVTAKPLLHVANRPLISYPLVVLQESRLGGEEETTVVVGHKKDQLLKYLGGGIRTSEQVNINGNLGAVEAALVNLNRRFTELLIIHADDGLNLSPQTIQELLTVHEKRDFWVTLLLTDKFRPKAHRKNYTVNPNSFEVLATESVTESGGQMKVFTGVYVFNRQFLEENATQIKAGTKAGRTITSLFDKALAERKMGAVQTGGQWLGVNDLSELEKARILFKG